jgi:hypothetical protein
VAAPPQPTPDTEDLSYIHNDADLPPVAIIDRSPIHTPRSVPTSDSPRRTRRHRRGRRSVEAFTIVVIIIAVLALVVVRGLAQSPWGVFSIGSDCHADRVVAEDLLRRRGDRTAGRNYSDIQSNSLAVAFR